MAESAPVLVRHAGGVSALPPGFRFRPTDEELVVQYLRRKAFGVPLPAAVIPVVANLYSLDPWDIPGASGGEKYFFAVRPASSGAGECARAKSVGGVSTASGRWKPAGKERPVVLSRPCGGGSLLVGVKRELAFAPRRGKKKNSNRASAAVGLTAGWVMHEYRLAAPLHKNGCSLADAEGEWVACRLFRKSRQQPRRRAGDGTAPRRTMPAPPSLSAASSASCVTDGSDQEEVSS